MRQTKLRVMTLCVLSVLAAGVRQPLVAQDKETQLVEARRLSLEAARLFSAGRFEEAIPLAEKSLALHLKELGAEHPDVASAYSNLGRLYQAVGDYQRAEPLLLRAWNIKNHILGAEHPDTAFALGVLGSLYLDEGDYEGAETLLLHAEELQEKAPGHEYPYLSLTLSTLGTLYREKGEYSLSESLFKLVLTIHENALGSDDPALAPVLSNLALLYVAKGDYVRAEPLLQRALKIHQKAWGEQDPNFASGLAVLAEVYKLEGDYVRAMQLYQQSLKVYEQTVGGAHPHFAMALNNLAIFYMMAGRHEQAEPLLRRALAIREKVFGAGHPTVAATLIALARVYEVRHDFARAESHYQRALAIWEKAHSAENPLFAAVFTNLAAMYMMKGDHARALTFLQRAAEVEEKNVGLVLATGSQHQKQLYLDTISMRATAHVSFHTRDMPQSGDAARLALTSILRHKGRALDAMSDQIAALRRRANPEDRKLFEQQAKTLSRLANLQLFNAGRLTPEARRAEISRLRAEQERLEGGISRSSAEFRSVAQPVTLDAVRRAIPPDASLVEVFVYYPVNPAAKDATQLYGDARYAVYVLRRDEAVPQWAELGDAAGIDTLVERLRGALRDPKRDDFRQSARALDERVMRPVRKLLGPSRRILLSPDGSLNLIPFASLVDENGRYLIEDYSVSYLTSGRDLLRMNVGGESREPFSVFADPVYDLTGWRPAADNTRATSPDADIRLSKDFNKLVYPPLPGTADEAAALSRIFPGTTLMTKDRATEAALKKVNRPRLLHIATHGFFLADQPRISTQGKTRAFSFDFERGTTSPTMTDNENPLLRSGLILAGVKQQNSGPGEDGVLTAVEAAGLDLWGTKLVVLSACETGLGDVKHGEGVYGLRRALVLAGSETQMMSLWKVSDTGTRDLMVAYYTRLQRGESRTEALRQVQLEMLQGKLLPSSKTTSDKQKGKRETSEPEGEASVKDYRHPYYWASFIPSGDWRNLAGQER
jgi:CHAT domain-containing protein/Flp pilus assembly protein TadD